MASVADSLRTSSININNISKSLFETKRSVSSVNDSVSNISKIIATNTRIKKEVFANSQIIESRRREAAKRKEIEDQLESSRVSTSPSRGLAFAGRSDKGPLGRLVGFLGFITAGWIVENLPTWIFMGQEFITRIQIFGRTMYNMVDNMKAIINGFGGVLQNTFNAIVTLDFNEFTEGSVAASFDELNLAVQGLGNDITETFRLFTTPLNESVETGEKAPALDEERPDTMFPEVPAPSPGGGGGGGKYKPLLDLISSGESPGGGYTAMFPSESHPQILGMTINEVIAFQKEKLKDGRRSAAIGRYQMLYPENYAKAAGISLTAKFSPENQDKMVIAYLKKNRKLGEWEQGKISDEAFSEQLAREFGAFKSASGFVLPGNTGSIGFNKLKPVLKQIKSGSSQTSSAPQKPSVTPQTPLATSFTPVTGTSGASMGNKPLSVPYSPFKPGSGATITSGKGLRWGKQHRGYDIAAATGTPLYAYFPGKVTHIGIDGTASSAGYGNWVVWQDDMYGAYHFFGHMRDRPSVRVGQVINQGTLVGYVGSTGESTGPHLHWEISNNPPQSNGQFTSFEDPGSWLKRHPLKYAKPGAITSQPSTPPAQISFPSSRIGQPAAMTPERKGSQIIFIDDTQPQAQAPQVSYPSQQPTVTPTITEFKLLNNFIKNKLLLDLAYL